MQSQTPEPVYAIGGFISGIETDNELLAYSVFPARPIKVKRADDNSTEDDKASHENLDAIRFQRRIIKERGSVATGRIDIAPIAAEFWAETQTPNKQELAALYENVQSHVLPHMFDEVERTAEHVMKTIAYTLIQFLGKEFLSTIRPLPCPVMLRSGEFSSDRLYTRSFDDPRKGPMDQHTKCLTCSHTRPTCTYHMSHANVGLICGAVTNVMVIQIFSVKCQHCPELMVDSGALSSVPDTACRLFSDVPLPFTQEEQNEIQTELNKFSMFAIQVGAEFLTEDPGWPTQDRVLSAAKQFPLIGEIPEPKPCPTRKWERFVADDIVSEEQTEYKQDPDVWEGRINYWRQRYVEQYEEWATRMDACRKDWKTYWKIFPRYMELKSALCRHYHVTLEMIHSRKPLDKARDTDGVNTPFTASQQLLQNKQTYIHLLLQRLYRIQQIIWEYRTVQLQTFSGLHHIRNELLVRQSSAETQLMQLVNESRAMVAESRKFTDEWLRVEEDARNLSFHLQEVRRALPIVNKYISKARGWFAEAIFARERAMGKKISRGVIRKWLESYTNPFLRPDGEEIQREDFKYKKGAEVGPNERIFRERHGWKKSTTELEMWALHGEFIKEKNRPTVAPNAATSFASSVTFRRPEIDSDLVASGPGATIKSMNIPIKKGFEGTRLPDEILPEGKYIHCQIAFGGCGLPQASMTNKDGEITGTIPAHFAPHHAMPAIGQFYHNEYFNRKAYVPAKKPRVKRTRTELLSSSSGLSPSKEHDNEIVMEENNDDDAKQGTKEKKTQCCVLHKISGWGHDTNSSRKTALHTPQQITELQRKFSNLRHADENKLDVEYDIVHDFTCIGIPCSRKRYKNPEYVDMFDFGTFDLENDEYWSCNKHEWPIENIHLQSMFLNIENPSVERLFMHPHRSHPTSMFQRVKLIPPVQKYQAKMLINSSGDSCDAVVDGTIMLYNNVLTLSHQLAVTEKILAINLPSHTPLVTGELMQNRDLSPFGIRYYSLQRDIQNCVTRIIDNTCTMLPPVDVRFMPTARKNYATNTPLIHVGGYMEFVTPKVKPPVPKKAPGQKGVGKGRGKRRRAVLDDATLLQHAIDQSLAEKGVPRKRRRVIEEAERKFLDELIPASTKDASKVEHLRNSVESIATMKAAGAVRDPNKIRATSFMKASAGRDGRWRRMMIKHVTNTARVVQVAASRGSIGEARAGQTICRGLSQTIPITRYSTRSMAHFAQGAAHSHSQLKQQRRMIMRKEVAGVERHGTFESFANRDLDFGAPFPSISELHRASGRHHQTPKFADIEWAKKMEVGDVVHISQGIEILSETSIDDSQPDKPIWRYKIQEPSPVFSADLSVPQQDTIHSMITHSRLGQDIITSMPLRPPPPIVTDRAINMPTVADRRPPMFKAGVQFDLVVGDEGGALSKPNETQIVEGGDNDGDAVIIDAPTTEAAKYSARQNLSVTRLFNRFQNGSDIGLIQDGVTMWTMLTIEPILPLTWEWVYKCICVVGAFKPLSVAERIDYIVKSRHYTDTKTICLHKTGYERKPLLMDASNIQECGWDGRDILFHILGPGFSYERHDTKVALPSPTASSEMPQAFPTCPDEHRCMVRRAIQPGCDVHIYESWLVHGTLTKDDLGHGANVIPFRYASSLGPVRAKQFIDDMHAVCTIFSVLCGWGFSLDDRVLGTKEYRDIRKQINTLRLAEQATISAQHDKNDAKFDRFVKLMTDDGKLPESDKGSAWALDAFTKMRQEAKSDSDSIIRDLAQTRSDIVTASVKKNIDQVTQSLPRYKHTVAIADSRGTSSPYQTRIDALLKKYENTVTHHAALNHVATVTNEDEMVRLEKEMTDFFETRLAHERSIPEQDRVMLLWDAALEGTNGFMMIKSKSKGKASDAKDASIGLDLQLIENDLLPMRPDGRITSYEPHGDGVDARGASHNTPYLKGLDLNASIKVHSAGCVKSASGQNEVFEMGAKHRNIGMCTSDVVAHHDGTVRDVTGSIISMSHGGSGSNNCYDHFMPTMGLVEGIKNGLQTTITNINPNVPWMLQPDVVSNTLYHHVLHHYSLPVLDQDSAALKRISLLPEPVHSFTPIPAQTVSDLQLLNPRPKKSKSLLPKQQVESKEEITTPTESKRHRDSKRKFNESKEENDEPIRDTNSTENMGKAKIDRTDTRDKNEFIQDDETPSMHTTLKRWQDVLTQGAFERLIGNAYIESRISLNEMEQFIQCGKFMIRHMHAIKFKSEDQSIRVPFLIPSEITAMRSERKVNPIVNELGIPQSDLLPSEVVSLIDPLIERLHSTGHTLFAALKAHRIHTGQRVLEWYVRSELCSQRVIEYYHLCRDELVLLVERLFQRFKVSRTQPGELTAVRASMGVCEPLEQSTLSLKHTLGLLISNTEGTPRFISLVGLTQSPNDWIIRFQLRHRHETPTDTGIHLVWDGKPAWMTEEQQIISHFTQLDPHSIFPTCSSVDYFPDWNRRLAESWRSIEIDGGMDEIDEKCSRYAFVIVMDGIRTKELGYSIGHILRRIRLSFSSAIAMTCLCSESGVIRVYGRLVAATRDIQKRMNGAEKVSHIAAESTATKSVHQYGNQRGYLEHLAHAFITYMLPQTRIQRVGWDAEKRIVSLRVNAVGNSVPFLYTISSRPECISKSFSYGDLHTRMHYFGIVATRRDLANEINRLVSKIQYISPSLAQTIADYMTVDGRLIPLDYRSFIQRANADDLTRGSLNRSQPAIRDMTIRGNEMRTSRMTTSCMGSRTTPTGPHFQRALLTADRGHENTIAKQIEFSSPASAPGAESETTTVATLPPEAQDWNYEQYAAWSGTASFNSAWIDLFGSEEYYHYMSVNPGQYDAESHVQIQQGEKVNTLRTESGIPEWASDFALDPEISTLIHMGILSSHDECLLFQNWTFGASSFNNLLQSSKMLDEALVANAAVKAKHYWSTYQAQLRDRLPQNTELEIRFTFENAPQKSTMNVTNELFHEIVGGFQSALGFSARISHRMDKILEGVKGRLEIHFDDEDQETDVFYTTKTEAVPITDMDLHRYSIRIACNEENTTPLTVDTPLEPEVEALFTTPDSQLFIRDKMHYSFNLDQYVTMFLDRTVENKSDAPSHHLELELNKSQPLSLLSVYILLKYSILIGNMMCIPLYFSNTSHKS